MNVLFSNISMILNINLIHSTIRSSTPVLFAALASVLSQQADILNVGIEGIMLTSSFIAVIVSYFTGSWILALIAAIFTGLIFAVIIAVSHLNFKADVFAIGMAINMIALALTRFLLQKILKTSGSFYDKAIVPLPRFNIAFFANNAMLKSLFSGYSLFEILGIPLVFYISYMIYKTVWGLRLRCVGQNPMAAATAGINVYKKKFEMILWSGVLAGIAGAHLSLGYSQMFTENMTNGRGFMGVAAMFFGGANPLWTWIGCLIFGFTDAIASNLQSFGLPPQFMLMIPYLMTVVVLAVAMARYVNIERYAKSALVNRAKLSKEE